MKYTYSGLWLVLLLFMYTVVAKTVQKADAVLAIKSEHRLYLMSKGKKFASFPVTFGPVPKGHKQQRGDKKTPEGSYSLSYKNAKSKYYKSIHISYPNRKGRANAKKLGVDPGDNIMIHGQPNGWGWASPVLQNFLWTDGCIALSNKDMDQVWKAVPPGTPIEIRP